MKTVVAALSDDLPGSLDYLNMVCLRFVTLYENVSNFKNILSLFDTGSPVNLVQKSEVPFEINDVLRPTEFQGLGKKRIFTFGKLKSHIKFKNQINLITLLVVPDETIPVPLLLGRDFLNIFNIHLCFIKNSNKNFKNELKNKSSPSECVGFSSLISDVPEDVAMLKCNNLPYVCNGETTSVCSSIRNCINQNETKLNVSPIDSFEFELNAIMAIDIENVYDEIDINPSLKTSDQQFLKTLINEKYINADVKIEPYEYEMKIKLTEDTQIHFRPRKLAFKERNILKETIDNLLKTKVIRQSNSPYASPIVMVQKKSGEYRKCVDYRALNKITVRDNFPLPLIDTCTDYLGGKSYFTTLYLKNGLFHVKIKEESKRFTSFVTPD